MNAAPSAVVRPGPRPQARSPAQTWARLREVASRRYQSAGPFAWRFAHGKLGLDPVFRHLVQSGLLPAGAHVLDIGCGQGLLASLLRAVTDTAAHQGWPPGWGPPPQGCRVTGIDLSHREIERARQALESRAFASGGTSFDRFVCGDLRTWDFPACEVVVILDVLHYMGRSDQDDVLGRACRALRPGGRLLLRVGDGQARTGFRFGQWVDWLVARVRGYDVSPFHGRTLAEWRQALERQGFEVEPRPMSQGTPFANVLLVARRTHEDAAVPAPSPDKELNR